MNYTLLKEVVDMVQLFEVESEENTSYTNDIVGFKTWMAEQLQQDKTATTVSWEGIENGRSAESVINTLIVHMNRYAKSYSKSAIHNSDFSTQEDFIYLINLKAFGAMTKMDLIKKNVHEKPVGIQIINRLLAQGWIVQSDSPTDKRSKIIAITPLGLDALEKQMPKIRQATQIVAGDLTTTEKNELIRLLNKLNDFHRPIYEKNTDVAHLLDEVLKAWK
ncbi:MarR family winged helix-turn-helix transcriptional regulator [Sphingobacterium sp. MYb382]|uniref:MarR family winged helix-turn-helix transcriptional regulator n=1 Tax=Sphingobacterium sp. MYb382 TaxID=2745278 RepID=UPI003094AC52